MPIWLALAFAAIAVVAFAWIIGGRLVLSDDKLVGATSRAQLLASAITALGIILAGTLYYFEQRWSPRFAVEAEAETHALAQSGAALLHVAVSIINQSRTEQPIRSVEVAVVGIDDSHESGPNEHGDLPGEVLYDFAAVGPKKVGAGETDFEYFELPVSCERELVRILIKVPHPTGEKLPSGKRWVYERKLIVPLKSTCAITSADESS